MMTSSVHIDDERLAQLAEGSMPPAEAAAVRQHLATCRTCTAAYVDAVRYRAAWLADAEGFSTSSSEKRLAMHRFESPSRPPPVQPAFPRTLVFATMAVASLAVVWTLQSRQQPLASLALDPAVAAVLSDSNGLLLPGTEQLPPVQRSSKRAGSGSNLLAVQSARRTAEHAYESDRKDPQACARLVAALLASGEVEAAADYAAEGLASHPDAVPLLVLAADARLRSDDLPAAEQLLARAARRAPRQPLIALNQGLVLRHQGRLAEARAAFQRAARSNQAAIAQRARGELADIR